MATTRQIKQLYNKFYQQSGDVDRKLVKARMYTKRGGQKCRCDFPGCGNYGGLHMHEIIQRSETQGYTQARQLSFQEELCSLVCPECHTMLHHGQIPNWRNILLKRNIKLYGYDRVLSAFEKLNDVMPITWNIDFPPRTGSEE